MYSQVSRIRPVFLPFYNFFDFLHIWNADNTERRGDKWNNQHPYLRIPCWRLRIYGWYSAAASGRLMNWCISQDFQRWSWAENILSAQKLWRIGFRKTQEKESENKLNTSRRIFLIAVFQKYLYTTTPYQRVMELREEILKQGVRDFSCLLSPLF